MYKPLFLFCVLSLLGACAEMKNAGHDIGHTAKTVTTEIGHGTRDAVKEVGKGTKRVIDAAKDDK